MHWALAYGSIWILALAAQLSLASQQEYARQSGIDSERAVMLNELPLHHPKRRQDRILVSDSSMAVCQELVFLRLVLTPLCNIVTVQYLVIPSTSLSPTIYLMAGIVVGEYVTRRSNIENKLVRPASPR